MLTIEKDFIILVETGKTLYVDTMQAKDNGEESLESYKKAQATLSVAIERLDTDIQALKAKQRELSKMWYALQEAREALEKQERASAIRHYPVKEKRARKSTNVQSLLDGLSKEQIEQLIQALSNN